MNITTQNSNGISIISINRPQVRNAVDGITSGELAEAFRQFEQDDSSPVAVLTGTGNNFCSGADLKALTGEGQPNPLNEEGDAPMGPTRMQLTKPVIAAISGYAVAGGLELALWCDMRVADTTATFGVFCRRWGVPLVDGGTVRLPRLIGMSRALDLILTGRAVDAQEAFRIGLVNRIVEEGQALDHSLSIARQIAKFPQQCLRNDRRSAYEQWDLSINEAMYNEFQLGKMTISSNETLEGAKRFAEGKGRHGSFQI